MSNTSSWQNFQKSWEQRQSIASGEGIPDSAIKAVAANDYDRIKNGQTEMSNQDAYAAMASAAGHKVLTPDPTPGGSGVMGLLNNARKDVQGVVTGIFHAPGQIASDVKGLGEGVIHGNTGQIEQGVNNIAQLLPGVTDAEQLLKGNFGYFYQHPIYSLLDVTGAKNLGLDAAGITSKARQTAKITADLSAEDVARDEGTVSPTPHAIPVPNLSDPQKALTLQNMIMSRHPIVELTARTIRKQPTLNGTLERMLGPQGIYGNSILVRGRNVTQKEGEVDMQRVSSAIAEASKNLSPDEIRQVDQLGKSGKNLDSIMNDPSISNAVKQGLVAAYHFEDELNKTYLATGTHVVITHPTDSSRVDIVPVRSAAAKIMRTYDTAVSDYAKAMQNSVDAGTAYKDAVDTVSNKPVWDPPRDSQAQGKLTADQYLSDLSGIASASHDKVELDGATKPTLDKAETRLNQLFAGPVKALAEAIKTQDPEKINTAIKAVTAKYTSKYYYE